MSKEIVDKLKDIEDRLLKGIEEKASLGYIEETICIIERIARIKQIEYEIKL